jgi:hypothetical protein
LGRELSCRYGASCFRAVELDHRAAGGTTADTTARVEEVDSLLSRLVRDFALPGFLLTHAVCA